MNKALPLLILIFYFVIPVSGSYIPICFKGHSYSYEYDMGLGQKGYNHLSIQCDTVINSKSYYKVFYTAGGYMGAIREDTVSQKVYFFSADSSQEYLAFDFSLQINDPFYFVFNNFSCVAHVDSIRTEFLYGQIRRVIYFDSIPAIIEGVGSSLWGLPGKPLALSGFIATSKLISTSSIPEQCFPTYIRNYWMNNEMFILYPNPVNDKIHIQFSQELKQSCSYRIFNSLGVNIDSGTLQGNLISFEGRPSGLYFIQIQVDEFIYCQYIYKP